MFSVPLLTPEEDQRSKALVFFIFFVYRVGEYVSLELFCFVNLTSSCLLIHPILYLEVNSSSTTAVVIFARGICFFSSESHTSSVSLPEGGEKRYLKAINKNFIVVTFSDV